MEDAKKKMHDFWNEASCGEQLYLAGSDKASYLEQMNKRYKLEPFIENFARFEDAKCLDVLEIGIGLGADHQRFAQAGAKLTGIDLTERAVEHSRKRFGLFGLKSDLRVADAEALPFTSASFDLIYSWGVLHHSPDTARAIDETWRILRRAGVAKIMVYHKHSLVGYMLWLRYAFLAGKPWRSLMDVYTHHLESPGTKAYTVSEARALFRKFSKVSISTVLTHADLLESEVGQHHRGLLRSLAKKLWPRRLLRSVFRGHGLFMLIEAIK